MADERIRLTDQQRRAQRKRSVAIAIGLVALVVIFYVISLVQMGPVMQIAP